MKIKEIFDYITDLYPLSNGASFDQGKIGLQFGSLNDEFTSCVCCLDATNEVIDYAIENNINLIISHHPFLFQPLLNLNYDSPFGKKLLKVLNNRINIMSFHTNYDVGFDGMNDALAQKLELKDIQMLTDDVCQDSLIRIGFVKPIEVRELCEKIKEAFNQKMIKVAGRIDKKVSKIAIVGGSGSSEFYEALRSGADVYITGQLPHHLGIEAWDNDFVLIEVSHAIEVFGVEALYKKLKKEFKNVKWYFYSNNTDPFIIL